MGRYVDAARTEAALRDPGTTGRWDTTRSSHLFRDRSLGEALARWPRLAAVPPQLSPRARWVWVRARRRTPPPAGTPKPGAGQFFRRRPLALSLTLRACAMRTALSAFTYARRPSLKSAQLYRTFFRNPLNVFHDDREAYRQSPSRTSCHALTGFDWTRDRPPLGSRRFSSPREVQQGPISQTRPPASPWSHAHRFHRGSSLLPRTVHSLPLMGSGNSFPSQGSTAISHIPDAGCLD